MRRTAAAFGLLLLCWPAFPYADITGATRDDRLVFMVIGDWGQQGNAGQRRVARAMNRVAARTVTDFIVTTGDNIYPAGVNSASDPVWQRAFTGVYSLPYLEALPWLASLGNHDYMGDIQAQLDFAMVEPRWHLPATYYSRAFEFRNGTAAELFFLDTNVFVDYYQSRPEKYHRIDQQDARRQLDWLRESLALSTADWKIVIGHHPVYSSGRRHGGTGELRPLLPPLFRKFGVTAYFAGHDHHLEHYRAGPGTHHFVSGAGAEARSVRKRRHSRFAAARLGFAYVEVVADAMRVSFIDTDGERLYQVDIAAQGGE